MNPWKFSEVKTYSETTEDTNFCAVLALHTATGIDFHNCLEIMKTFGRNYRMGIHEINMMKAFESIEDFSFTNVKNKANITVHQFIKKYPNGTYIIASHDHLYTIKNGRIYDYRLGLQRNICNVFKVEGVC